MGIVDVVWDDHALAGGEAVGLEHGQVVGAENLKPLVRGLRGLEEFAVGVPHAGGLHDLLGEPLGRLDLRGVAGGTEGEDAAFAQRVDEAGGEGCFGSDDDEVDATLLGGVAEAVDVGVVDREVLAEFRGSGVARRGEQGLAGRRLRQFPGQRVLASTAADDQDSHGRSVSDMQESTGRVGRRVTVTDSPRGIGMRRYRDDRGNEVQLSDERLRHILERHPEMARQMERIPATLAEPDAVTTSHSSPTVDLYHRQYPDLRGRNRYLCLVVKRRRSHSFILTGYLTRRIKGA